MADNWSSERELVFPDTLDKVLLQLMTVSVQNIVNLVW